mgnify:CR=1 FL=1
MSEHTDSCSWPAHCAFLESESCDCLIPHKSGYKDEIERNYADGQGLDAYKPCKYYLTWEQAIEILSNACETRSEAIK